MSNLEFSQNQKSNYPFIEYCDEVSAIAKPILQLFDLNYFSFARYYWQRKIPYFNLSTSAEWEKKHFDEKCYLNDEEFPSLSREGLYFLDEFNFTGQSERSCLRTIELFKETVGCNSIAMLITHNVGSTDFVFFASSYDYSYLRNNIINNQNFIKKFIQYFKAQAQSMMHAARAKKVTIKDICGIDLFDQLSSKQCEEDSYKVKQPKIDCSRFYLDTPFEGVYLTSREVDCIKLLTEGNNMVSISDNLKLSYSTVRGHIDNVKLKLKCYSIKQLSNDVKRFGILKNIDENLNIDRASYQEARQLENSLISELKDE